MRWAEGKGQWSLGLSKEKPRYWKAIEIIWDGNKYYGIECWKPDMFIFINLVHGSLYFFHKQLRKSMIWVSKKADFTFKYEWKGEVAWSGRFLSYGLVLKFIRQEKKLALKACRKSGHFSLVKARILDHI